jgi:hypothetical protein
MNREELKKRLRMKVRQQQIARVNNTTKSQEMDRMRNDIMEEVKETMVKTAKDSTDDARLSNKNKSKAQNKKLKILEKKYGKISDELYHQTILHYKTVKYENDGDKNHDKNIISLYLKQNKDKVENDNKPYEISTKLTTIADKIILDDDDESISSELSM